MCDRHEQVEGGANNGWPGGVNANECGGAMVAAAKTTAAWQQ